VEEAVADGLRAGLDHHQRQAGRVIVEEQRERRYRRVGDTAKCPACGVSMDPEAYRCPKCRIYFCFKCRRRVQPRDPQFQCMNQQCDQYGKLLCNACVVEVPVMGDRSRPVLVEAEKPGYHKQSVSGAAIYWSSAIASGVIFAVGMYFGLPWWGAALGGLVLAVILAGWLGSLQDWIAAVPAVYTTVTENVEIGRRKSCIACRQAVEHIR